MRRLLFLWIPIMINCSYASVRITSLYQITKENSDYLVSEVIDMKGESVSLPNNTTLRFSESGSLVNGTVEGNNTQVVADRKLLFDNVSFKGTWNNSKVYSEWVGLRNDGVSNDQCFASLMALCNGPNLTHLYVQEGDFYVSAHSGSAPIILPSNVYWHNKARIHMMATDLSKYSIVLISKVNNVTIDGGEFIGDVETHLGKNGEWGHGIKCGGATNVTLKNLICRNCWGDGIDLIEGLDDKRHATIPCEKIRIENVKSFYNRRQGMSIEAAYEVIVVRSEFKHTGKIKSTAPSAGVDIEPWNNNGVKVKNVSFFNCQMRDNMGLDFQCEPNLKMQKRYKDFNNNILLKGCNMERVRIQYTNGLSTQKCQIEESLLIQNADSLQFYDSYIKRKSIRNSGEAIKMKKCKGDVFDNFQAWIPVLGIGTLLIGGAFAYINKESIFRNENNRNHNNS